MKFSVAAITFSLILPSFLCAQQIYKWKDENGQWHISDEPPPNLPSQPQPAPSLTHGDPSRLEKRQERVGSTKTPSQSGRALVYDQVICRERISRQMYEAEAIVQNLSARAVTVLSSATFFDPAGRLIEKKDNPPEYEERLEPGQKTLARVTIMPPLGSFREFPPLGSCQLDVRPK